MSECKDVPEELKQNVFLEASNKCAVPGCQHADVEVHHIVPWEEIQKTEFTNLISLCSACHKRAHDPNGIERMTLSLYKVKLKSSGDRLSQGEIDDLFASVKSNMK